MNRRDRILTLSEDEARLAAAYLGIGDEVGIELRGLIDKHERVQQWSNAPKRLKESVQSESHLTEPELPGGYTVSVDAWFALQRAYATIMGGYHPIFEDLLTGPSGQSLLRTKDPITLAEAAIIEYYSILEKD